MQRKKTALILIALLSLAANSVVRAQANQETGSQQMASASEFRGANANHGSDVNAPEESVSLAELDGGPLTVPRVWRKIFKAGISA